MANFNNIKNEIDQNVNTNGQQAITGAILNQTLKDMIDEVDAKKQDTLVAGQNITISGNVISATGGSGQAYSAGDGINIDSNNEISVVPSDIAGQGLTYSGDNRALEVDFNVIPTFTDLAGKQDTLTAGSNIQINGTTISATDTTYSAGSGILIDQNNEISADTSVLQPKLTAGSGISISAQNVISATGGGGGGTTYGDGDAIHIDSNDNINVLYGNGLQLDGNGALEVDTAQISSDLAGNGLLADGNGHLELDQTAITGFLPLVGGTLQDTQVETQLDVTSPTNSNTHVLIKAKSSGPQESSIKISCFDQDSFSTKATTLFNNRLEDTAGHKIFYPTVSSNETLAVVSDIPNASSLAGSGLQDDGNGALEIDTTVVATQSDLLGKQDTLTASNGISIDASNNISVKAGTGLAFDSNGNLYATGGGGTTYTAGTGISIDANNQISAKIANGYGLGTNLNGELLVDAGALAGNGLQVDQNGQLEVVGGGGGSGLWTSGSGVDSLLSIPASTSNGTASGARALSAGWYTTASGDYSVALGNQTSATRTNAFAVGKQSDATGISSVALGDIAAASGDYSVALGSLATASGTRSFATSNATASNTNAVALGDGADATALLSTAIGTSAKATNTSEIALGKWNKSTSTGTDADKTQFSIGNGTALGSESNIIEAKKNNDVYLYGVGGFTGANYSNAQTLQDVINNGGGGGTSFTPGDALELDQNDNLNVLYGSGLTLSANNELEVDPSSISGFLPLDGGTLQGDPLIPATDTVLDIVSPLGISNISLDSGDNGDPNDPQGTATISMNDSNGYIQIKPDGVSDGTYTASWPSLSGDTTFATLEDIPDINNSNSLYYRNGNIPEVVDTLNLYALQCQDLSGTSQTAICSVAPTSSASACLFAEDEIDQYDQPTGNGIAKVNLSDTSGDIIVGTDGILDNNTGYKLSFPTLTQNETIATLSDIQGGGSYTAGSGIDITSGTISVDETYLDSVYLPIIGGSLENTSNHTDLRVDAPNAESDNFVDILSPGTGVPSVELGTDTNTQGEVESLKFKGDADIDIKYVGDNTTYTLSFPTLTQNETIATLSDTQGYLPLTGGSLKDTAVGATETLLDVQAPDSTSALSFSADTLAAMIQMSADRDDANVADGTTYGINIDNSGDVDILVKTVNPLDPTDISTTTYTQTFQQKSGTIALLSDISGGGTSYTAGSGISISAQNVITNTAPDTGLWMAGNGTESILSSNASVSGGANYSIAIGHNSRGGTAVGGGLGSVAIGYTATTGQGYGGDYAVSIGYTTSAQGDNSVAIGTGIQTPGDNSAAIGYYNVIYPANSSNSEQISFAIGNGVSNGGRSDSFEIKKNNDAYLYGIGGFTGANASNASTLQTVINGKQDTLTAGTGISISGNVISATGGGGGGLWTSGTGTDSLVAPATITAGLSVDPAQGTGAISCGYDTNADGDYAFASGAQALASGDYSFAANNGTSSGDYSAAFNTSGAYGDESFAAGTGSTANATSSIALAGGTTLYDDQDPNNIIDAAGSVAIGDGAAANAYRAIAIGSSANTSDTAIDGIAIGVGAYANAQEAVAIGSSSTAEGLGTVALSSGTASGERSTAMSSGDAIGSYSVAGGLGALTGAYSSVALGFQTMTYDQGDPTDPSEANAGETALGRYNYTEQDFIFSVGCGQEIYHDPDDPDFEPNPEDPDNPDGWTEIVRQNAITITSDGNIYIKGAGGYLGQGIAGADSLQTLLYNLNPQ